MGLTRFWTLSYLQRMASKLIHARSTRLKRSIRGWNSHITSFTLIKRIFLREVVVDVEKIIQNISVYVFLLE